MAEIHIEIDDEEFIKKPEEERSLMIFKAVSCQEGKINRIDTEGCQMAKNRDKKGRKKIVLSIGGISLGLTGLIEFLKSILS